MFEVVVHGGNRFHFSWLIIAAGHRLEMMMMILFQKASSTNTEKDKALPLASGADLADLNTVSLKIHCQHYPLIYLHGDKNYLGKRIVQVKQWTCDKIQTGFTVFRTAVLFNIFVTYFYVRSLPTTLSHSISKANVNNLPTVLLCYYLPL